ncbi:hypothetical protein CONLIGDRAFT_650131 [Coniochaeta ligniaria NRRL 30616]|uniref:Cell wall protein n=1 Tax=Coniochaeta ligniaria NRRL 30616 TaxID=1408157 RepID=A0A1J7J6A5_9PEZI|nr:hypothetical protein CONLIGDRAFT_650131 [Coniochaeta ligniaria NRRL 30616]
MLFSSVGSLVGAGLIGLSQASPVAQYVGTNSLDTRTVLPCVFDLAKNYVDEILYHGVSAPALPGVQKEVTLGLALPKATISGDVSIEVTDKFLIDPTIKINLGGVKVYLEVDLEASAAVSTSVELFASPKLDIDIPGLLEVEAGAAFALDLVLAVSAAIDVEAGVYLTLPDLAFVEISLLTKEIVSSNLEGLVAQALPTILGAEVELEAEVDLTLGLRLRTEIGIDAGLSIIGLDVGAGVDVAVWINLFDYTTTLVAVDDDENCLVSAKEVFTLVAGVAIDLDVAVGDILDISLAPSVLVTLATGAVLDVCLPAPGTGSVVTTSTVDGIQATSTSTISLLPVGTGLSSVGGATYVSSAAGVSASGTSTILAPVSTGVSDVLPVGTGVSNVGGKDGSPGAGTGYSTNSAGVVYPTGTGLYPIGTGASSVATTTALPYGNSTTGTTSGDSGLVTSTVTTTAVYTITSCAATVPNCPASLTQKIVTSTVIIQTTVCPATMTTAASSSSSYSPAPVPTPTGTPVTITPCATPTTSTYVAPTNVPTPAPTVTIVDTTTYCPESGKEATSAAPSTAAPSTFVTAPGVSAVPTGGAGGNYTQIPPLSTGASAPVGTGAYTPTYATPKPTAPITAGAGKVVGGAAAVVLPIVAALML